MKNWFKKTWNWLLGKTTVDEKVVEVVREAKKDIKVVKARAKRVAEETKDVVSAAKEVVRQSKDVVDAARGGQRRGRKTNAQKKNTPKPNVVAEVKSEVAKKPAKKRYYKKPAAKKQQ